MGKVFYSISIASYPVESLHQLRDPVLIKIDIVVVEVLEHNLLAIFVDWSDCVQYGSHAVKGKVLQLLDLLLEEFGLDKSFPLLFLLENLPVQVVRNFVIAEVVLNRQIVVFYVLLYKPGLHVYVFLVPARKKTAYNVLLLVIRGLGVLKWSRQVGLDFKALDILILFPEPPEVVVPSQGSDSKNLLKVGEPLEDVGDVLIFETIEFHLLVSLFFLRHNDVLVLIDKLENIAHVSEVRASAQIDDGVLEVHVKHGHLSFLDEYDASRHKV